MGDLAGPEREPSRGLFEEPRRGEAPADSFTLPSAGLPAPGAEPFGPRSAESDTGRFAPGAEPDADRFSRGETDPGYNRFASGGTEAGRGRSAPEADTPPAPAEPFNAEIPGSFGADRQDPAASPERSAPGAFASDLSETAKVRPRGWDAAPEPDRGWDTAPEPDDNSETSRNDTVGAVRAAAFGTGRGTTPSVDDQDAAESVREPYQARRRQVPTPAFGSPARRQDPGAPRPSADSLDPESLLKGRRNGPSGGWRKLVFKASAGLIKPGESPEVRRRGELLTRARTPVATGHHRVAVLSLKGGVGKTTTTVGLGATLAQIRGDRVIAVDANPDRGTLSDKVELETAATVRDLLNERGQIKRYVDIRAFTSQAPSRLEILASDRDPSVSEAFSASDYQSVAQVLENFYSICITDCGTGLLHSAMSGVLGLADQLVLVSSPSVDGARAASATLDWLEAHHYEHLVRSATVVLCSVRPRSKSTIDLDRLEAHFAARCRAVIRVPYDPHLEEGAEIDLERLQPATRESYLRLAASVGDGFAPVQP
ncbi:AAA family ATPase [Planomonospora sp. ID67723]|nr:AAA family ATPase [Planomonospora sp. ID67723]